MIACVVASTTEIADRIRLVELAAADGGLPGFDAGDHIDVVLGDDLRRSYSLVGTPDTAPDGYRIAVALTDDGRGGAKAVHALVPGQRIEVSAPVHGFPLDETAAHSVLIAGGIGITPVIAMVESLQSRGASWELHYAVRSRAAAAFLPELDRLAADDPGRVRLYVSDEDGGARLPVGALLTQPAAEGTHFYCCGPATLLDDVLAAGHPDRSRVHLERFEPVAAERGGDRFQVELARTGVVLDIGPDDTILDAVLDEGVDIDFSCMEGICGSCRTTVVKGTPEHRDSVLSAAERAADTVMMICCSRATGDRLVLDL